MIIKGREYILSERCVKDVSALAYASADWDMPKEGKEITPKQYENAIAASLQALNDSLKATYKRLPWYLKPFALRYRKFFKPEGLSFLLENVGQSQLIESQDSLLGKDSKKKTVTEKPSPGKSEKD